MLTPLKAVGAVAALAVTFGLGVVSAGSARPAEAATSDACLEYIDVSEQFIGHAGEALGYASDGFHAASRFDVAGINASTAGINRLKPKLEALTPRLLATKEECRGKQ